MTRNEPTALQGRTARHVGLLAVGRRFCSALSIIAVLSGVGASGTAQACAFDMVKPARTVVDWIVETEALVLARPAPDNPFVYNVTDVLIGAPSLEKIDQLVDSNTRRKLKNNTSDAVLFAKTETGEWRNVAYVNDEFRPILETALTHRHAWQASIPQSRLDFITGLQNRSDIVGRSIVIGELDKVPYEDLRQMDLTIPAETLLADLWTKQGYPYQAIRVLLLGLSGTPNARAEVVDFIDRVADWNWANNLGAFAAALIEIDGTAGVERLWTQMLADTSQPIDKIEQIVMALSVHYQLDDPLLRNSIEEAITRLIDVRPEAGVVVARQFTLRSDWSQMALLAPLVRERKLASMGDLLTVSVYLARAREETRASTPVRNDP